MERKLGNLAKFFRDSIVDLKLRAPKSSTSADWSPLTLIGVIASAELWHHLAVVLKILSSIVLPKDTIFSFVVERIGNSISSRFEGTLLITGTEKKFFT